MNEEINKEFGKLIAAKRKEMALSQEELANKCDLHRTYMGAIERGEKSPTLSTIAKIFNGLNIPIYKLWEVLTTD